MMEFCVVLLLQSRGRFAYKPTELNTPARSSHEARVRNTSIQGEPPIYVFNFTGNGPASARVPKKGRKPIVNLAGPVATMVPKSLLQSGFNTEIGEDTEQFVLHLGSPRSLAFYNKVSAGQVVNQLPGSAIFARKDFLANQIQKMQRQRPDEGFNIMPVSYQLPADDNALRLAMDGKQWFIYKPALSARGMNIKLIQKVGDINTSVPATVQEYMTNVLLVDKRKFDLRIFFLVTSVDPFVVYMYNEGIVRYAAKKFKLPSSWNHKDLQMHLTNFAVNKKSSLKVKQSLSSLLEHLDKHPELFSRGKESVAFEGTHIKEKIMENIRVVLQKALMAAYDQYKGVRTHVPNVYAFPRRFFGYYGADIILDKNGNAKILEINASPSLTLDTPEDYEIKPQFLQDLLNVVGIPANFDENGEVLVPAMGGNSSAFSFEQTYAERDVSENFTAYETRVLQQMAEEASRLNGTLFSRILPDAPGFSFQTPLNDFVRQNLGLEEELRIRQQ